MGRFNSKLHRAEEVVYERKTKFKKMSRMKQTDNE